MGIVTIADLLNSIIENGIPLEEPILITVTGVTDVASDGGLMG